MKRFIYFVIVICLLNACGENGLEDNVVNVSSRIAHFRASFAPETKTAISNAGVVTWSTNDVIQYYSSNGGSITNYIVPSDGPTVSFDAQLDANAPFLIAVRANGTISEQKGASFLISDMDFNNQNGSFSDLHIGVAKTYDVDGGVLTFHNLTSYLTFTLERTDIAKVVLKSNNATPVSVTNPLVSFSGETPSIASATAPYSDGISVTTNGAGTFYIALLPVSLDNGFRLVCYDTEGAVVGIVNTFNALALTANKIVNLGTIDTRIGFQATTHHQSPVVDMSGTANSYIVTPNSSFQFNATVKGHKNELIGGDPNKAIVIWESFGTTTKPNVGDIIKSASYSQGIVTVETGESGNALVAIIDRDETILWSWHIWVTDYNPALDCDEYANNAGYVMDRNLGALSATPGDVRANGLLYEWGRKDPFMGGGSLTDNDVPAAATIDFPSSITSDEFKGTIEYATQNPTQFIVYHYAYLASYSNYDWYYGYYVYENTRWNSSKGTYDPCPAGWRVPNGGDSGLWAKAGIPKSNEGDAINKGVWVSRAYCGADTWYPAPGLIISRNDHSCQLQDVGVRGEYYACTHNNIDLFRVGSMSMSIGGGIASNRQDSFKANGFSIRCVADKQ